MPKIKYRDVNFSADKLELIERANRVIAKYQAEGFSLTLRQLYYVFVANDLFPDGWKYEHLGSNKWTRSPNGTKNAPPNYSALGDIVSDARMAGLIDWLAIVDRSRSSYANQHFAKPSEIIGVAKRSYAIDKWKTQPCHVEVWVEKEALEDVLERACTPLDVRYFACKGYTSQSAMWEASQRLLAKAQAGKQVHVVHLGDHDPSGIDMSRDIFERLSLFVGTKVHVLRVALNMVQVRHYNPPPNPAKVTDSRFAEYQKKFGDESWELDALEPRVLVDIVTRAVTQYRDQTLWDAAVEEERRGRKTLDAVHERFPEIVKFLKGERK